MTLLRLIQGASILAGMTFACLSVYSNPAHADTPQFCVIASNGKTACGTLQAVERGCVTTAAASNVCGKFKTAIEGQAQRQEEARTSTPIASYRKEVDNFVYTLEGCQRVDTSVRCQVKMVNKGKERRITMYAGSTALVDSNGKSHPGFKADLGGGPDSTSIVTMSSGNDVSIAITFENVPTQIIKAQLLNVAFSNIKPVQFRNVPISN